MNHLPGIHPIRIETERLATRVLTAGADEGEPVLFLHGNLSSATFWEETMLALPDRFRALALDQRGYGLSDREARIDATRGVSDWVDDAFSLADLFGWRAFHLVAHSLGGCVAWAMLGAQPERLKSVTLVAPGPPCGFGGARGERGALNYEDGAGSGAGLLHPEFTRRLREGEREITDELFSPRAVMKRLYWSQPFRPQREEQLLTAMLQVRMGEQQFPGDWVSSPHWPGIAPGKFGPINALSPLYNRTRLDQLLAAQPKPPLLWIYGTDDAIVADASLSDPGMQGLLGLRPDWPGADDCPPQPLLTQVSFALDQYERGGGNVQRIVIPGAGHSPFLERPAEVNAAIAKHLTASSGV